MIGVVDRSAAPVDRAALDRLRLSSTEAFLAAAPQPVELAKRSYSMFAIRSLIAVAALLVVALLVSVSPWSKRTAGDSLGAALHQAAVSDTLHLQITRANLSGEAWAKQPGLLRWDRSDGTYEIASGRRLWQVDEQQNRAASQPSPYFHDSALGLDLLDLLEVPENQREVIRRARPVEQTEREGDSINVYRTRFSSGSEGSFELEAVVDSKGRAVRSLVKRAIRDGGPEIVAEIELLAMNAPVDEEKFVVSDTLTEDGRIGKVTDVQGIVALRPALGERWTPVCNRLILKPGDQVRTDRHGANAVALKLVRDKVITLGPASLVELVKPGQVRLLEGQIAVATGEKESLDVLGPAGQKLAAEGKKFYRVDKEKLAASDKPPLWYQGFSGAIVSESLGSLVANVDGRNVPLTVGYHKVSVEIRDQIARTTIEESFQNRTKGVLEGTFYFPLPQDASISGFGMWIGETLVEADVVEKQRAREIYETILREKRDPGLLEWTGGNLFKARVYPIPAEGEKRIKITYTQVLPLKGNRCRYSYALQSELLRQHPLRELSLDVKIHSALPLASVASPTHETRTQSTKHSAQVSFSAQEYTPTRDFEVTFDIKRGGSDVVLIPHRRGDDGYFLLLVNPPAASGQWERDVLPGGEPLDFLILADTSASIDARQRAAQGEFVAALLSALTPKDKFNLAACDVECDLVFEKQTLAEAKHVAAAREFLARRRSLGWTDLDKAFSTVMKKCNSTTQIVYIGDGVVTTGDADPVAFAQRLRREYHDKSGTFHAVTVGSSFEPLVLKAIAAQGGGTVRRVSGDKAPSALALELLSEIAQPGLRDLHVEFAGLRTARVYPGELPNVAAGTQQVILGRYLPEGKDQKGKVVVTGTQGGRPVKFSADVSLADAEEGNSFIPRLWARMHLDTLLEQGSSESIKEEVIGLSEEFHIITPYTSLLVLESDADRERFKVQRRFQMRDGEKFFAEGRDKANYDLVQQQMRRAGAWRVGLRRSVLSQLATLGRNPRIFAPQEYRERFGRISRRSGLAAGDGYLFFDAPDAGPEAASAEFLGIVDSERSGEWTYDTRGGDSLADELQLGDYGDVDVAKRESYDEDKDEKFNEGDFQGPEDRKKLMTREYDRLDKSVEEFNGPYPAMYDTWQGEYEEDFKSKLGLDILDGRGLGYGSFSGRLYKDKIYGGRGGYDYFSWVDTLFPHLPGPPGKKKPKEPKVVWPAEAQALAASLLRKEKILAHKEGLVVARTTESFDVSWNELTSRSTRRELFSADTWLIRSQDQGGQTLVNWCDAKERGVYSRTFQLGRRRASVDAERRELPFVLADHSLVSLEQSYRGYLPKIEPQGEGKTLLLLSPKGNAKYELRILIDTVRKVILKIEERSQGKTFTTTKFDDFVEVAGTWWAHKIETLDAEGRRTTLTTQTVESLPKEAFTEQLDRELAGREKVQFLALPGVKLAAAKQALAAGKASFDDHFALLLHFARSQQWTKEMEQLAACEKLAAGKPGLVWVHDAVLNIARRHEELRERLVGRATKKWDGSPDPSKLERDGSGDPSHVPESEIYFLAHYLTQHAGSVCESNETLAILDSLKPIFERQPAHVAAFRYWRQMRLNYLQATGRIEEAIAMRKALAMDYPREEYIQRQYAEALAAQGDYAAAYAYLSSVLVPERKWSPSQEENLRNAFASLLDQQGRLPDLVEYLAAWVKLNPVARTAYQQYLSALIRTGKEADADALIAAWLKATPEANDPASPASARLWAAVYQALGQGHNLHTGRIEEKWLTPLAETVLFFARHETQYRLAETIMDHTQFRASDEARRVRRAALDLLKTDLAKLTPEQIDRLVVWIQANDPAVEAPTWKQLADSLLARWKAEEDPDLKHLLAGPLLRVLRNHSPAVELLAFLRLQISAGPELQRTHYISQLWDALLSQPYSAEIENEAFALLAKLGSDEDEPGDRLWTHVAALHKLVDRLLASRQELTMSMVEHQEKLTRKELADKRAEVLKDARMAVAERLAKEAAGRPEALARWFTAERLYLDTLLEKDLAKSAAEYWQLLGPQPVSPSSAEDEPDRGAILAHLLRARSLIALLNLASRKTSKQADVEKLTSYLDKAIAKKELAASARMAKYQLLIALDGPKDLEMALKTWVRDDEQPNRWRLSLGRLLVELGRLDEAVKQFEQVEADDELGPAEHRTLSGWYLALDRKADHERALLASYKTTDEYRINRRLSALLQPWQRSDGHLPSKLDDEVLRLFAVLFEKSQLPQNYLWPLQQFYQSTRDFRLLAGLADACVGHTAGKVYPFLSGMKSVLNEVRDEATVDSLVERVAVVRKAAKTTIDQRAVDLLELLVERRAAEVQNQPGPHVQKALAALERAGKREWSPGEPLLMAQFLADLGQITQAPLAKEQLRQLEMLHAASEKGSEDRLHIAHWRAAAYWSYGRQNDAIAMHQAALAEYLDRLGAPLPERANGIMTRLVGYLEAVGHFREGEDLLQRHLKKTANEQQTYWLTQRLFELYENTIRNDGTVSLGKGAALYRAVEPRLIGALATPDHNHRYTLLSRLCGVYRTAHYKKIAVADDLRKFSREQVPELLKVQTNNYTSVVGQVASVIGEVSGPHEGLAFYIQRIENEPAWFHYNNRDGWSQHSWQMAQWREVVTDLGDLDARLLKIVIAELKRDLSSQQSRSRVMYHKSNSYYWSAKEADFAKAAEEVLAQRSKSGASVKYIADYLWYGLAHRGRAIEIMLAAHKQEILDESGQATLVNYLHDEDRFGESVALLEPMVKRRPENIQYRVWLMRAYFKTKRPNDLLALLKETDVYFHQEGRWTEHAMASLAASCLDNELFEQSVAYYNEVIPLHERTAARRGIGTLSGYYSNQALAYAGLGKTAEAVEAASGAIVSWGPRHNQRAEALRALERVLEKSPDLAAFIVHLDKKTADLGQENPIVRKALGKVLLAKEKYADAITQLQLAVSVQPNDAETHQALIACYDKQGDKAGAVNQIFASLELNRRDIKLYEQLGQRYTALEQPKEAERAFTSLVEALPNEAEGHTELAEIRQKQNRWPEAIGHWEQVARLRALEPTGLVKLAAAQIHEKQFDAAGETIKKLRTQNWPTRFDQLPNQLRALEEQLKKGATK